MKEYVVGKMFESLYAFIFLGTKQKLKELFVDKIRTN